MVEHLVTPAAVQARHRVLLRDDEMNGPGAEPPPARIYITRRFDARERRPTRTSPLAGYGMVAGKAAEGKRGVTGTKEVVAVDIQHPEEPGAENTDLGASIAVPIPDQRHISG